MKKPIIGITLDYEEKGGYSKFPWYALRHNYLHSVEKFGGIPFPLFHTKKNINQIFEVLDGLIITGGNFDIDPKLYGKKLNNSRIIKNTRTQFEISICKKFLNSNKPIFGICGGEQLLNVVCGGTLIQHIQDNKLYSIQHEQPNPRDETSHQVKIVPNTKLRKIIKKSIIKVNSAHHQAVDKIGKKLSISSYSSDGIVEAIEHTDHNWCIGVQWHPEFLITLGDQLLMKNFIKYAKLV
tara:strand:- start:45 stop:758 length:714 start_codon:yes stop_codon:yes gene_type:complete